ncbi:ricin-type beta-trefoil lectin domain protein [Streptomyces sp. NBC_01244]|uniref:ricin-type beta-trefoil lectin domain protein n=1 Tax=Streptomyces sp. NBC_01244 TaxID=2903797 RepID=UPI002E0F67AA|nr:ricin-type beta-trefoil lectin domain protein [Streptomyces sp. NBC_01244]
MAVVLGSMIPVAATADEAETESYVWVRSSDPTTLQEPGEPYQGTNTLPAGVSGALEPPEPETPTPEYEAEALKRSGATYGSDTETKFHPLVDVIDFAGCNASPEGKTDNGFIVNHFEFCRWNYNTLTKLNGQGRVEGQVRFKETEVGEGHNNGRQGTLNVKVTDVRTTGVFVGASMTLSPTSRGYPGVCTTSFGTSGSYTEPLSTWNNTFVYYRITSTAADGDQSRIDKPTTCNFRNNWKVNGTKGSSEWFAAPDQSLRMDSAEYLKRGATQGLEGAIFNRVTPWLSYDYADASVKQVAEHIFTAYLIPESTDPRVDHAKKIPGRLGSSTFLTRNYPKFDAAAKKVSDENLKWKNAACGQLVKGNATYECDEFPFASTKEGAATGNFSVRYVPGTVNSTAGGRLSAWYARDRILHGDKFQVLAKNHGKLVPATLVIKSSGEYKMALDVASRTAGSPARIYTYSSGPSQDFWHNDDGQLRVFSNSCLDASAGTAGTAVKAEPCSGADSQIWGPSTDYRGAILHRRSGLCLALKASPPVERTPIILSPCTGMANQIWVVT